jgi:kynurenine formamidase
VTVGKGDILLVRTGHMSRYLDKGDWRHFDLDDSPGVSVHTAPWLHARQIAAIASDNYAVEVRPSELPPFRSPLHICAIPSMGLTLGEIFFLEELAADGAVDGRYAFLLVAPPLPVTHPHQPLRHEMSGGPLPRAPGSRQGAGCSRLSVSARRRAASASSSRAAASASSAKRS